MTSAPAYPLPVKKQAPANWTYLDYPGSDLIIQATTKWEKGYRAEACSKEPWTVAWIESMAPGADVFWNVGANVGSYALIAASRGVYTVAIEPGYASYAALANNILANRLEGMMTPICAAIGEEMSIIPLAYRSTEAGAASHGFGVQSPKSVGTLPTLTLALDTLGMLVKMIGAPPPTHLLIDVDGAEPDVLKGGSRLLTEQVRSVMIEVQDGMADLIDGILQNYGYTERARHTERGGQPLGNIHYAEYQRG